MGKIKSLFAFCLLFFIFLSLRVILFTSGTIGHNWDWFIPASIPHLQNLNQSLLFSWRSFSLGEPISLWLPSAPFFFIFTVPSFFGFDGDFISKFLIIITMVLSGTGMFFLLENILKEEWKEKNFLFPSFIGGFFYAFSPFLFADLIGGAATQFFAYALIPWLLFFFKKTNQEKRYFWPYFLPAVLTLSLLTISLQIIVITSIILVCYFIIQKDKAKYFKNLIFLYLAYFLLNLYWILPTILEYSSIQKSLSYAPPFSFFTIHNLVPSLLEAVASAGYTRPFFTSLINENILSSWFFIIYLGLAILFLKNIFSYQKESLFWFLTFLLSLIFVTGGKEPLGGQIVWLYQNFPPMSLFRSPQHFIVLPTLATSILTGLGIALLKSQKLWSKILIFFWLIFWLHPVFLSGDLGSRLLQSKNMEHLDVYRLSPGYERMFNYLKQDQDDYKILFLPLSGSPEYLKTEYQNKAQGGDPLIEYPLKDTIVTDINYGSEGKIQAGQIEEVLCNQSDKIDITQNMALMNVKYLILRKDVIPHFSPCKNWNWEKVYGFLLKNPQIKKIQEYDLVILFKNNNYLPHFWAVGHDNSKIPQIESVKINPTLYKIKIEKANQPFNLIFSESFNQNWKVYLSSNNKIKQWQEKPLFENTHFKINGFANAWEINKSGNYEITVEYWPQRLVYLGGFLSLLFFLILSSFTLKNFMRI